MGKRKRKSRYMDAEAIQETQANIDVVLREGGQKGQFFWGYCVSDPNFSTLKNPPGPFPIIRTSANIGEREETRKEQNYRLRNQPGTYATQRGTKIVTFRFVPHILEQAMVATYRFPLNWMTRAMKLECSWKDYLAMAADRKKYGLEHAARHVALDIRKQKVNHTRYRLLGLLQ